MRGTSRQKALEALWERNRAVRKELSDLPPASRMKELQGLPVELRRPYKLHGAPRPKGLRGPALFEFLRQQSNVWRDKRFDDCINALFEHEIVDGNSLEFTDKQGPELDSYNQRQVSDCLIEVRLRIKQGMSERQACTEVAAERGLPGNSLTAASQRLRDLRKSSGK